MAPGVSFVRSTLVTVRDWVFCYGFLAILRGGKFHSDEGLPVHATNLGRPLRGVGRSAKFKRIVTGSYLSPFYIDKTSIFDGINTYFI